MKPYGTSVIIFLTYSYLYVLSSADLVNVVIIYLYNLEVGNSPLFFIMFSLRT